jgi:hypothetical protein
MKKILILILLFTINLVNAQNDVLIVYVDASESSSYLIQIQEEVNSLVQSKSDYDVYLYISKGESPIVTNDRNDVAKQLRKLRSSFITSPDYKNDVVKINKAILENGYISNINDISFNGGLPNQFEIHFWLEEENYNSLQLNKKIIEPLLFANKLTFKDGLQEYCTVILHLTNEEGINKQVYE